MSLSGVPEIIFVKSRFLFSFFLFLSVLDISDSGDPDTCLCCCMSIRLSDLLAVNVGLFDQYFRVVGGCFYACSLMTFQHYIFILGLN